MWRCPSCWWRIGPARSGSYAQVRHGRAGSPRLLSERANRRQRADYRGPVVARLQRLCDLAGGAGAQCQRQLGGSGANVSAVVGIAGVAMLAFGLLLALRQITAAPLSRLGLIGARRHRPNGKTWVRTAEFARHNGGIWQLGMIHEYYDARNVVCFAQYIGVGGYQTGDCGVSDQGPQDR